MSQEQRHPPTLIGTTIGDLYELTDLLGSGGWSHVYKAKQVGINRIVAIKILQEHLTQSPEKVSRFQREALAASKLSHPSIASIYEFGVLPNGQPYIVMEYLKGVSLAEALQKNNFLPPAPALAIFSQVSSALQFAHAQGIVHRDIKPGNIFLCQNESGITFVKLLDFGIAKTIKNEDNTERSLTKTGEVMGTAYYLSPEQGRGSEPDARADLYSLGCVMFETLTGKRPFEGESVFEIILKHTSQTAAKLSEVNPKLSGQSGLEDLIRTAMQKERNLRFQSAQELHGAIEALQAGTYKSHSGPFDSLKSLVLSRRKAAWPVRRKKTSITSLLACLLLMAITLVGAYKYMQLRAQRQAQDSSSSLGDAVFLRQVVDTEPLAEKKIALCEKYLADHHGIVYAVNCKLINLHLNTNRRKSFEQVNNLLYNGPDEGMLNYLAGGSGLSSQQMVQNLESAAAQWQDMDYIAVACWLKIAELYADEHDKANARRYYEKILALSNPKVDPYRRRARVRLNLLNED